MDNQKKNKINKSSLNNEENETKNLFNKITDNISNNTINPHNPNTLENISQITEEDFTKTDPHKGLNKNSESSLLTKFKLGQFLTSKSKVSNSNSNSQSNAINNNTRVDDSMGFTTKTMNSTNPRNSLGTRIEERKKLPLIGHYDLKTQYSIGLTFLVLSTIGLLYAFYQNTNITTKINLLQNNIIGLLSDSQGLTISTTHAITGKQGAFDRLIKQKTNIDFRAKNINNLAEELSTQNNENLEKINKHISNITKNIVIIEKSKDFLSSSSLKADQISKQTKNLTDQVQNIAFIYSQLGASQNDYNNIFYIRDTLTKINNNITQALLSDTVSNELISSLKIDREGIKNALIELRWGSKDRSINQMKSLSAITAFNKLGFEWLNYSEIIDNVYNQSADLVIAKETANNLTNTINLLNIDLNKILENYDTLAFGKIKTYKMLLYFFGFFLLLSLLIIVYIYLYEKENSVIYDKIENQRSNMAILKLLDEMSPLSNGDLTKKVTVSEDITGAIADAINLTIEDLSELVRKIKTSVYHMKQKTDYAAELSSNMLNLNDKQARRIENSGEQVINISNAINKISYQTNEGAKVANQTVVAAKQGEKSVAQSLQAMDSIKNQMNESIRLMKRLNDSSKQISIIVDLLSDITEETSVLALNATIQAAKAGDAGKGFKIVADSVQSLAQKAGEATRKVQVLIETTKTDIQEMVESVKKTNEEVEKGTSLSSEAEQSLTEIYNISHKMLEIVKIISSDAQDHANLATSVSDSIREILITNKSSQEINQKTAMAVKEINKISDDLSKGAKGFTIE